MRLAVRMTLHAIRKFWNSGRDMILLNFDCILVRMAVVAGVGRVRLDMAGGAGNVACAAVADRKIMFSQFRWQPAGNTMAHGTLGAEQTGVNFGIGMTGITVGWRPAEIRCRMASRAAQIGVPVLQGKGRVSKRLKFMMAGQAIAAVSCHMLIDKRFIDLTVTGFTQRRVERITGSSGIMAILTSECTAISPLLMFHQAITSLLVRKRAHGRRSLIG